MTAKQRVVAVLGCNEKSVGRCALALEAAGEKHVVVYAPATRPQDVARELGVRLSCLITVVALDDLDRTMRSASAPYWFAQVEACDVLVSSGVQSLEQESLLRALQPAARRVSLQALSKKQQLPRFCADKTGHSSGVYRLIVQSHAFKRTSDVSESPVNDRNAHVYRSYASFSIAGWRHLLRTWPSGVVRAFGSVSIEGRMWLLDQVGSERSLTDEGEVGGQSEVILVGYRLDTLDLKAWFDDALLIGAEQEIVSP